jgi:hypothetical protein
MSTPITTKEVLALDRGGVINHIIEKGYFVVQELVGPEVFAKHGQNSWFVLTTELLRTLLFIREKKGVSMIVNTWHKGGRFKERGHRANVQHIVYNKTVDKKLYTSGHPLGMGVDFNFKGEMAEETRAWLVSIEAELPHKIRLEHKYKETGKPITWVHLDVKWFKQNMKVYLFDI